MFPRKYVSTNYDYIHEKAKIQNLSRRLIKIFKFTNKNVGVNLLRSSHASYLDEKRLTVKEKDELAKKMRTSRKYLDMNYIKILPEHTLKDKKEQETNESEPVDYKGSYEKQLERSKEYCNNHKKEVLEKQKEYSERIPKEIATRKKIIYYLNTDKDYKDKIKPETIKKYEIKYSNGVYV